MIRGKTIALGPILPIDVPNLFLWADNVEDARLNEPYRPLNWQQQEVFWTNAANDPSRLFFAIRSTDDPAILGYVQIMEIDPIHRSATIGMRIGDARQRGQGRGREALTLAIDYCWRHLNLTRIGLRVFSDNRRAIGLYEALGFVREGVLCQALFIDGAWVDVVLMALIHPARAVAPGPDRVTGSAFPQASSEG